MQAGWRELSGGAVSAGTGRGPLLVGGFSFRSSSHDVYGPDRLPEALMWVPRVLHLDHGNGARELLLNTLVTPDSDPETTAGRLLALTGSAVPGPGRTNDVPPSRGVLRETPTPSASEWNDLAKRAIGAIGEGRFDKVVLARTVEIEADAEFDITAALRFLERDDPDTTVFGVHMEPYWFLGATPEYLLKARADHVETLALAGSAPRGRNPAHDEALARELHDNVKERHEHRLVAAALRDFLRVHCHDVRAESAPEVARFARIQHLRTRMGGTLAHPETDGLLDLVADLHPTPALGGHPRAAALNWLNVYEELNRGWYAAPLGWMGGGQDGEFAVAIRSALISGSNATLYAGCGIVDGSTPEAEYRETSLKLEVMLKALGLPSER